MSVRSASRWLPIAAIQGLAVAVAFVLNDCSPKTCVTNADCDGDQLCQYKIGSCEATGECLGLPNPRSFIEFDYCGCNGSVVRSGPGPGYMDGFASGPTKGLQSIGSDMCEQTDGGGDGGD